MPDIPLTISEAAELLGHNESTVRRWADRICRPTRLRNGTRLLSASDVERLRARLAQRLEESRPHA